MGEAYDWREFCFSKLVGFDTMELSSLKLKAVSFQQLTLAVHRLVVILERLVMITVLANENWRLVFWV